jgi:hypothetical protein
LEAIVREGKDPQGSTPEAVGGFTEVANNAARFGVDGRDNLSSVISPRKSKRIQRLFFGADNVPAALKSANQALFQILPDTKP